MDAAVYALRIFLYYLIEGVQIAFFLRAILSWFDPEGDGRFSTFLLMVTEPLIFPLRKLCEKKGWFENTPIDVPFMGTLLILMLIQMLVAVL